jgi:hypothetical protein
MIATAFLMMAAMVAAPASDQSEFDMQCMVATQLATEQLEGTTAMATQMAAMYYFGRVDGAFPDAVLEERLASVAKAIEGRPLGPLLEQCGAFMKERGEVMQKIGARLDAREKAGHVQ